MPGSLKATPSFSSNNYLRRWRGSQRQFAPQSTFYEQVNRITRKEIIKTRYGPTLNWAYISFKDGKYYHVWQLIFFCLFYLLYNACRYICKCKIAFKLIGDNIIDVFPILHLLFLSLCPVLRRLRCVPIYILIMPALCCVECVCSVLRGMRLLWAASQCAPGFSMIQTFEIKSLCKISNHNLKVLQILSQRLCIRAC